MQGQTPSSKWWKWLVSFTMVILPIIFEMNCVEMWQSSWSQSYRFFLIWRGIPRVVLMSPNAIAKLSLCWHIWTTFLLFPHPIEQISYKTHTLQYTWTLTIFEILQKLQSSSGGFDPLLQMHACHSHFNPTTTFKLFFLLSFLFNIFTKMFIVNNNITIW